MKELDKFVFDKNQKLKMIQVYESTHKQVKEQSVKAGMAMSRYVQYLADKEK
jgi:hypothetical protein